jgi:phage gp46-like protein
MVNILLQNTLDGGDIAVKNAQIQCGDFLYSAIFVCLFGGNREGSDRIEYKRGDQNLSFWGNAYFDNKYNSQTERAIMENITDNNGLSQIKRAVINDLQKLVSAGRIQEIIGVSIYEEMRKIKIEIYLKVLGYVKVFEAVV